MLLMSCDTGSCSLIPNILVAVGGDIVEEGTSTDDQSRATKQEQANLCAVTVLCAST